MFRAKNAEKINSTQRKMFRAKNAEKINSTQRKMFRVKTQRRKEIKLSELCETLSKLCVKLLPD
jgi:L-asparaginase/Glu-tRNA(Gln) amidotransferase subunit D